jgi:radical SAM-linked protein
MTAPGATRVRIRFTKAGKVRFVSHRDVARLFERALRKLRLPVAYTEGYSPRPKLSFGLALPVAHESDAEYLDVDLRRSVDLETLPPELTAVLPDGITVEAAIGVEPGTPSLQQAVTSCDWHIEVLGATEAEVSVAVARVMAASELLQERARKGKTTVADVRPAILHLEVAGPTADGVALTALLATESVSLRPAELVRVIGPDLVEGRVRRTHQWMIVDGARCEPVSPPGPSARHELRRAS